MIKNILTGAAMLLLCACSTPSQPSYTISMNFTGNLSKVEGKSLVLLKGDHPVPGIPGIDTVTIKNGKAVFTGTVKTPQYHYLIFSGKRMPFKPFYLENANYKLTADASDMLTLAEIETTGLVQKFLTDKQEHLRAYQKELKYDSLIEAEVKDLARLREVRTLLNKEGKRLDKVFMDANPTSPFTLGNLVKKMESMEIPEVEKKLAAFSALPEYKGNSILRQAIASLKKIKSLQPGHQIPDFTINDIKGQPVTLSDIYQQNKVTVVEFWASWCGGCRLFNPTLKKIYEKYHSKGMEILGVSMDHIKSDWEKAVKEDGLPWIHVSNLQQNGEAGNLLHILYIPQNILIDRNGKILGRQLDEQQIIKILEDNL